MKTVVFFANPFGYGPTGKMFSIADYFQKNSQDFEVVIVGSSSVLSLADKKFSVREADDRSESSIIKVIKAVEGEKIIISSQNRFAIRAARDLGCKSAFLDGLSWFWKTIPEEHFDADIIFWIGYPEILKKVPRRYKSKTHIIHGISAELNVSRMTGRKKIFYIGGCKNPLTQLPTQYISLTIRVLREIYEQTEFEVTTDKDTKSYIEKNNLTAHKFDVNNFSHSIFIEKLASSQLLISNGGQTASLEAAYFNVPILYFLPINLSQRALVKKIQEKNQNYPAIQWEKYIHLPDNINSLSEAEAIKVFEQASREILSSERKLSSLIDDLRTLVNMPKYPTKPQLFKEVGSSGASDIFKRLKNIHWI